MGDLEKSVESPEVRSLAGSSDMGESTKLPPSPSSRSLAESNSSGGSNVMKVTVDPKILEDVERQSTTPILRFYRFITSEYRLLFTLVFCLNLGGVVGFLYEWATNGTPSKTAAALATSINLVVSIVIREEHVVNFLYLIFASAPKSFPLWLRRRMGKIYHLGGLHSGCGTAATFWFILLSIESSWRGPYNAEKIISLIIIYILDTLLISMIVMAHPSIRGKLHNGFELIHRFAGWSALALLWTLTVLNSDLQRSPTQKLSKALLVNPNMWLLAIATWSIIMTWLNCRKIKVQSEQLSNHALRIHFDYVTPSPGTTIRISSSPLMEWHAFATVADPKKDGFSLIISNAGDWTKKLINEPPKEIWARRTPTCGVLRIAPMFRSILLVATGSGIAPCLPVILAQKTRINLFWSTRDPLTTYGDEIGSIVKALGPNAYIHNTTTMGRPATLPLVIQQYRDTESEAVIVISNPKLTIKLVQDLEYLGIPAFGPIWDS